MDNRREIEQIAYEIYLKSGCVPGRELDNWLEAERIVCTRLAADQPSVAKKAKARTAVRRKAVVRESKTDSRDKTADKITTKAKSSKSDSARKEASF